MVLEDDKEMPLTLITPPSTEPVTLAEAKLFCRVDDDLTKDDGLISALIVAARDQAEHILGRALMAQTWERTLDAFPHDGDIELGYPPVQSVESVTYVDPAGAEQTLSSGSYLLDSATIPGWVILGNDEEWPETMVTANAVRVRFISGYASAAEVPESIKTWIKLHVGEWYANRELASDKQRTELSYARGLLHRYMIWVV